MNSITANGYSFTLHSATGEVVDPSKGYSTQVTSSGGGGYVGPYGGTVAAPTVTSTTSVHDQFFLRSSAGKETPVRLTNFDVAIRTGHEVTVAWAILQGRTEGTYYAVYNRSTDVVYFNEALMKTYYMAGTKNILIFIGLIIVGVPFFGIGAVVFPAIGVYNFSRRRRAWVDRMKAQTRAAFFQPVQALA